MRKLFLILGVIGGLSVMDSYALKPGDVMKTGDNEWWACPPDCSFRQLSNGSWTCMDHDVECPGIKGGIRSYDHYPTDYVVNDENAQTGVMIKDASVVGSKKLDKTNVSRAARVGSRVKQSNNLTTGTDKVGSVVITYSCPSDCTLNTAGGSSGNNNGAFVVSCIYADGSDCGNPVIDVTNTGGDTASVARSARTGTQVKKNTGNVTPMTPQVQDKAGAGAVGLTCPANCEPYCAILGNTVMCDCRDANNNVCPDENIITTSASDASVARVAKLGTQLKKTTNVLTNPVDTENSETENPVEKLKITYGGNEYSCNGCNRFVLDEEGNFLLPPRCDGCETVIRKVSQNR